MERFFNKIKPFRRVTKRSELYSDYKIYR